MSTSHSLRLPGKIIYGTAWKKEKTSEYVINAVNSGFRMIDTACQPKHYHESGVGEAISYLIQENIIQRQDIFLQTKFTSVHGQDPTNIPYDPSAPLDEQVRQSFRKSLENLQTTYIDSLLMHSPMPRFEDSLKVWSVFEEFYNKSLVLSLGISNIYDLDTLQTLYHRVSIKPSFIQNRFYSKTNYDQDIRRFCKEHDIIYQSFWSLTANQHVMNSGRVAAIASRLNYTPAQVFFQYLISEGITPLTGTTSPIHMTQDLMAAAEATHLTQRDVQSIRDILHHS